MSVSFEAFSERNPAFWYGLFVYLGATSAIGGHIAISIVVLFLAFLAMYSLVSAFRYHLLLAFCCGLASFIYVSNHVLLPPDHLNEIPGKALLEVVDISSDMRYGRTFYRLTADIKHFQPTCGGFIVQNIPCRVVWHEKSERPHGGVLYEVNGVLQRKPEGFSFKSDSGVAWAVQKTVFSLTELRYDLKRGVKCFLAKYLQPGDVRFFLEGVLIGEFHENHLKACLKRFGLQHILVVSGFHFSLVLAIFMGIFRIFLSIRMSHLALIGVATAFFLFIGPQPSVFRSYIASLLVLMSAVCEKSGSGINGIGLGLIILVLYDPTMSCNVSFQMSFLATWAILILHPLCKNLLFSFLPRYSVAQIGSFSFIEQVVFVISTFILSSLALVLAVTTMMLPVSLWAFQSFPLLGIFYNSFFPFIVSIAITLVILGGLFFWLPPLAAVAIGAGAALTECLLTLVHSAPTWMDCTLHCEHVPIWILVLYLCLVSAGAIWLQDYSTLIRSTQKR